MGAPNAWDIGPLTAMGGGTRPSELWPGIQDGEGGDLVPGQNGKEPECRFTVTFNDQCHKGNYNRASAPDCNF